MIGVARKFKSLHFSLVSTLFSRAQYVEFNLLKKKERKTYKTCKNLKRHKALSIGLSLLGYCSGSAW